jgi:hypothetical protein
VDREGQRADDGVLETLLLERVDQAPEVLQQVDFRAHRKEQRSTQPVVAFAESQARWGARTQPRVAFG